MSKELVRPLVGIGVFIVKDRCVLLGKRKNTHGAGTWALVGGHLEYGESLEECSIREVKEETDLEIKNIQSISFTNDVIEKGKHYVTLFMAADYESGELKIMEPEKLEVWKWFSLESLPEPLFPSIETLAKQNIKKLLLEKGFKV